MDLMKASAYRTLKNIDMTEEIAGHQYAYHVRGPHNGLWCYVVKLENGYKLIWGDSELTGNGVTGFDSITISNSLIFNWAFDSLGNNSDSFKSKRVKEGYLNRSYTMIVDSYGLCKFEADHSTASDDEFIQKKYLEFFNCLKYLSMPELRHLFNVPDEFKSHDKLIE